MMDTNEIRDVNYSLVITCEHGGNRIPVRYADLFKSNQGLLDSHRGFDSGALSMAKDLATAFAAPLVVSKVSRLLVDLNRSIGHPKLHHEVISQLPSELRSIILRQYYHPYRTQVERLVRQAIFNHGQVVHLSSHSFTPEMNGEIRNADIGLLYDPARLYEVSICEQWKLALSEYVPELSVRRNYPYKGKGDGLTRWLRQHLTFDTYIGIELEINQKHIIKRGRHWPALRKMIIKSFRMALAKLDQDFPIRRNHYQ
jgi:predicted N-formylglutamate amidohydrolase